MRKLNLQNYFNGFKVSMSPHISIRYLAAIACAHSKSICDLTPDASQKWNVPTICKGFALKFHNSALRILNDYSECRFLHCTNLLSTRDKVRGV